MVILATPKELMKKLKQDGWYVDRVNGSHHVMRHPSKPEEIVVPMHRKDIPVGLLNALLKKSGLKQGGIIMSKMFYPAIFHNEGGAYWAEFPDLPGCFTDGDTVEEVLSMAKEAMEGYLFSMKDHGEAFPTPSNPASIKTSGSDFVSLVEYDEASYIRRQDARAVKKTLTIPRWLDTLAKEHNLKLSNLLQNAIRRELHLENA